MFELKCPKCGKILDTFVLTERGRCAYCGAEASELLTLLQTRLDVAEEALKNIMTVFNHGGTINEVARIVVEVL